MCFIAAAGSSVGDADSTAQLLHLPFTNYGRWGAFVLGVEVLGATSTVLYGLNIILTPVHEPLIDDPANPGLTKVSREAAMWGCPALGMPLLLLFNCIHAAQVNVDGSRLTALAACASAQRRMPAPACYHYLAAPLHDSYTSHSCVRTRMPLYENKRARTTRVCTQVANSYHVRVLVPCYKEDLEIVAKTIQAAYNARLPDNCSRTIYLCDDGKDKRKRKWCAAARRAARPSAYLAPVCKRAIAQHDLDFLMSAAPHAQPPCESAMLHSLHAVPFSMGCVERC